MLQLRAGRVLSGRPPRIVRAALIAAVTVLALTPALAAIHEVHQVGTTFQPDHVVILPGDTVRWIWNDGVHSVTSGTGSADPQTGVLFDELLYVANTTVEYTFNTVGSYPYYCTPHESLGMNGDVMVESPTPTEDTTWGRIKRLFDEDN